MSHEPIVQFRHRPLRRLDRGWVRLSSALLDRIKHPVMWIGALLDRLERQLNDPSLPEAERRRNGWIALALLLAAAVLPALLLQYVALQLPPPLALVILACLASTLIAQKSLDAHVAPSPMRSTQGGVAAGREAVSMIVGRNPHALDEAGVARAAIESLAENFADGIVAPVFWIAIGGLPGGALYKAINTADSMIGHKSARYRAFGWAAAQLDDLVNLPASRLAACWLVLAAAILPRASAPAAIAAVRRDAGRHRSPNAGWPEAAMAGALGLRLAGPRVYGEVTVDDAFMGDGRCEASAADIRSALRSIASPAYCRPSRSAPGALISRG